MGMRASLPGLRRSTYACMVYAMADRFMMMDLKQASARLMLLSLHKVEEGYKCDSIVTREMNSRWDSWIKEGDHTPEFLAQILATVYITVPYPEPLGRLITQSKNSGKYRRMRWDIWNLMAVIHLTIGASIWMLTNKSLRHTERELNLNMIPVDSVRFEVFLNIPGRY